GGLLSLLDQQPGELGMTGAVAAQDRVDADPDAGGEARLHEQLGRNGWEAARRAPLKDKIGVVKGGGDRVAEAAEVVALAALGRVGDREDAVSDGALELWAALAHAGDEVG